MTSEYRDFSGTSVCGARGTQPEGQRAAQKARGDRCHPGRAAEVSEGRERIKAVTVTLSVTLKAPATC